MSPGQHVCDAEAESDSFNFGQCIMAAQWAGDLFIFSKSH